MPRSDEGVKGLGSKYGGTLRKRYARIYRTQKAARECPSCSSMKLSARRPEYGSADPADTSSLGVPTSSPRQRQDRAVGPVELRISFATDRMTVSRIKKLFPSASFSGKVCTIRIAEDGPADVAERIERLIRLAKTEGLKTPKGFK